MNKENASKLWKIIQEAGDYLVLCQDSSSFSSFYTEVDNYIGNTGFGFAGGGELLRLLDSSGVFVDMVEYDDSDVQELAKQIAKGKVDPDLQKKVEAIADKLKIVR